MSDLIDRQALLNEYDKAHVGPPGKARKLIEDASAASPWHSVEDGLPEPLVRCLIWDGHEVDVAYFVRGFYNSKTDWYWRKAGINRKGGKIPHREVKMWMPIEPPKEDA